MAISIRNSAQGISSSTSSLASTTISATIGDIIVIQINHEATTGNPVRTVSSIGDGTANVYTQRFAASQSPAGSGAAEGFEVWWAYVANTMTAATITVTMSGNIDDATVIAAAYQGFTGTAYHTAPWDINASLPATAQSLILSQPTVTGVSTTSTVGMLLFGWGSLSTNSSVGAPAGFTEEQRAINNGAVLAMIGTLYDLAYSSAQSSITIATAGGTAPTGWIAWADALTSPADATVILPPLSDLTLITKRRVNPRPFDDTPVPRPASGQFLTNFVQSLEDSDQQPFKRKPRPLDETANPVGVAIGQFIPNFMPQWNEKPAVTTRGRNPRPFDQHDIVRQIAATPVLWFEALDVPSRIKPKGRLDDAHVPFPALGQFVPNFVQALQRSDIVQAKLKPRPLDETTGPVPPSIVQYLIDARSDWQPVRAKLKPMAETSAPIGAAPGQFLPNFVQSLQVSDLQPFRKRIARFDDAVSSTSPPAAAVVTQNLIDAPSEIRSCYRSGWMPLPTSCVFAIPIDDLWFEALDVPTRIRAKGRLTETAYPFFQGVVGPTMFPIDQSEAPLRIKAKGQLTETAQPAFRSAPVAPTTFPVDAHGPSQKRVSAIKAENASSTADPITTTASATITSTISYASSSQIVVSGWQIYDPTTGPVSPPAQPIPNFTQALDRSDIIQTKRKPRPLDDTAPPGTAGIIQTLVDVRSDLLPVRYRMRSLPETSAPIGVAPGQFVPNFLPQWAEQSSVWRRRLGAPAPANTSADPIFIPPTVFVGTAQAFEQATLQRPRRIIRQLDETMTPRIGTGQFLPNFVSQWGEPATIWRRSLGNPAAATATIDPISIAPVPFVHRLQPSDLLPRRIRIIPLAETSAVPPIADGQFLRNLVSQWYERPIPTKRWRGPRPLDPTDAPVSPASGQFLPNFVQALQRSDSRPYVHYIRILDETTFVAGGLIIIHNFAVCAHTEVSSYGASTRVSSATSTTQFVSC